MVRLLVAALVLTWAGGLGNASEASGLSYKAGIGYDFFSQQYFLDSLRTAGVDSVLVSWSYNSIYLNDLKGFVEVRYSPRKRRFELGGTHEQTREQFRTRLYSSYRPKFKHFRLDSRGELEWRQRYRGTSDPGDSYVNGRGQAKIRYNAGKSVTLWSEVRGEFVTFAKPGSFTHNYVRLGEKIGATFAIGLSTLDIDLFGQQRRVGDSTRLSYSSIGADASFFGLYFWGDLDILTHFERRSYNRLDSVGNYSRFETSGRSKVRLGSAFFLRPELQLELNAYQKNDVVSQDYWRLQGALLAGYSKGASSLLLGPATDILSQEKDSSAVLQDYSEWGARCEFDYTKPSSLFGSVQGNLGYRRMQTEDTTQSSFGFLRISLMGDLTISGRIGLNALLGAEWEWHRRSNNNTRLVLISSSLTYSF